MNTNNFGKIYGIIAGIGFVLYFLLFYFISKEMMMGLEVSWSSLMILIPCVFIAIIKQRKTQEGKISFRPALRTGFQVVVLSNLIFYIFFYFLLKMDPELVTILGETSKEFFKAYVPAEQMEAFEKSYEDFSFGFTDVLKYLARSIIGGFFIALLAALILRR